MKHNSLVGQILLAVMALALVCLAVPSTAAAQQFFGPMRQPQLGFPPMPTGGWQAQQLGGIQPPWQAGRVAPEVTTSQPWGQFYPVPSTMYDTRPGY